MHDIAQKQIFLKNCQSWTVSGFGGEISGSGKKVRVHPDLQHWFIDARSASGEE
jgi:hypothetical protein